MKYMKRTIKAIMFLASLTANCQASDITADTAKLQSLLKTMSNLSADFVQHSSDAKGGRLSTMKGHLLAKAPGKFRWETTNIENQQLLVSNGETLWLYDPDLMTVTVQALDKRVEMTPALLLTGEVKEINSAYEVYSEQLQDEQHFVLIPKTVDALFDRLRLEFDKANLLQRMVIKDELGQKTMIYFSNVKTQEALNNSHFEFIPPEGVDVIAQGEQL